MTVKELLTKAGKNALIFGAAGVVLTLLAVPLAGMLASAGLIGAEVVTAAAATSPIWNGAFFGTFGALIPFAETACNKIFPPKEPVVPAIRTDKIPQGHSHALEHACCQEKSHVAALEAERAQEVHVVR